MAGKRAPRRIGYRPSLPPPPHGLPARYWKARVAGLTTAVEHGRVSALAAQGHRELEQELSGYGDAFDAKPFDPALLSLLAHVGAYSAPWLRLPQLHTVNRASLWLFGVDWQIDRRAQTQAEVKDLVRRSLAVADGDDAAAGDGICRLLARVRADLAQCPGYAELVPAWRQELGNTLDAMAREQGWRLANASDRPLPTVTEYLANSDNLGLSFVFVTLLIVDGATAEAWRPGSGSLREATGETQRLLRLVNDVGTRKREAAWGDVNILQLGSLRSEVDADIRRRTRRCLQLFGTTRAARSEWTSYLERVIGFNMGLYGVADYWGRP